MSTNASADESQPTSAAKLEISRPIAHFKPSVWGDRFANYEEDEAITQVMQEQIEELKLAVRRDLFNTAVAASGFSHQLMLNIDAVQRLGVAYHFQTEIEQALERAYATYNEIHDDDIDLYNVALRFRLLRRHGYHISCDIFNQFKNESGDFKESLVSDVSGMLNFYEAAHLRVHGEKLLDEVLVFTTAHLESIANLSSTSSLMKSQITEALVRPILKTPQRMGAPRYMSIYKDQYSHNKDLLKFAKLDYDLVQCSHKKELSELIRWYKEENFYEKFPFVRNRMVEIFLIATTCLEHPQYVYGRNILAKHIMLTTVLDDIHDAYGTYDDILMLSAAIQRWDAGCTDQLHDYTKDFYQLYLNALNEIEEEMIKQGRSSRVPYAKEIMKKQSQLYFTESSWLHEASIPSMDEYLSVAVPSIGMHLVVVMSLVGMGDIVTNDTFEWVNQNPKIIRASSIIFRLMDDIAGHKFEKERKHIASSVDCYMKEHGVPKQETLDVFNKQIMDFWKDINEEILRPTVVSNDGLDIVLNATRIVDVLYKREDIFTQGGKLMEDMVTAMFIDPLPL